MESLKDIDADQWLPPNKAAYLGSLAILGNIAYDSQKILDTILEETMQHPIGQGKEQRYKEGTRRLILGILTVLLGYDTAQNFKASIESIDDLPRLKELFSAAIHVEHEDEFWQVINETNA